MFSCGKRYQVYHSVVKIVNNLNEVWSSFLLEKFLAHFRKQPHALSVISYHNVKGKKRLWVVLGFSIKAEHFQIAFIHISDE